MVPERQLEAYELLRTEIVRVAVFDYKKALRKSERLGYVCKEQEELEQWFVSRWGQALCGGNGEYIMNKCRETYKYVTPYSKKPARRNFIPEDVQIRICEDYKNGVRHRDILKKYRINPSKLYSIVRRWE